MTKTREEILREHQIIVRARQARLRTVKRGYLQRIRAPHWTIVRTPVGREKFAARKIEENGSRTFMPRIYDGKRGPKLSPLFPGYLFVELTGDAWMHLQYSPGVIEVIKNQGKAVKCQDAIINQLLREQGEDGYIDLAPARFEPKAGEQIKIVAGLFKDHIARYIGRSPDLLMTAALEFFGKQVTIPIKRSEIAKIT
jgi:transcription antitermination factor NusG